MSENLTIDTSKIQEVETDVAIMVSTANSLVVKTFEQCEIASEQTKAIKKKLKTVTEFRKSLTDPLDLSKKRIMDSLRPATDSLTKAEKFLKSLMNEFDIRQEKIRKDAQDRLQREADNKARRERERLEKQAEKWEAKGKAEKAEEIRERKDEVIPDPVPVLSKQETPKGISYIDNFTAVVIDASKVPRPYLIPSQKLLDAAVKANDGGIDIPGVKVVNNRTVSSRAA